MYWHDWLFPDFHLNIWFSFSLKPVIFFIPYHKSLTWFCWGLFSNLNLCASLFSLILRLLLFTFQLILCLPSINLFSCLALPLDIWWSRVYYWGSTFLLWWGWCYPQRSLYSPLRAQILMCFQCGLSCAPGSIASEQPCRASSASCDQLLTCLFNTICLL